MTSFTPNNHKIELEQITVEVTRLQDEKFLALEKSMIDDYSQKGYELAAKNPLAEMRMNEKTKIMMLTFLYTFKIPGLED